MTQPLPVRYRVGGQPRLSVTQVLTLAGRIESRWFSPEAAERGEMVHAFTEQIDKGQRTVLPSDMFGYGEAYLRFLYTVKPVWSHIEHEVHHEGWQLAGRIDRVASELFGRPGILDIKTGGAQPWHANQLAAYNAMCPSGVRWCLYLMPDGQYRLQQHEDARPYREFFQDLARVRGTVTASGDYWVPIAA
jgi:hypothetical protein